MIHRTFLADATHVLLSEAAQFTNHHARAGEMLVIAGTRTAADDFVRFHCGDSAGIHRLTLSQLVAELTTETRAARNIAPLNGFGAEALAARAIHRASRDGILQYFGPVSSSPGLARALTRTLRELRLEDASFEEIARAGAPGADIAALHSIYQELLAEGGLADFPALLRMAGQVVLERAHRFLGLPVLLLDLPAPSARAAGFVATLAEQAPEAMTVLLKGDEQTLRRMRPHHAPSQPIPSSLHNNLAQLREYLFLAEHPPARPADSSFEFFSAAGEGLECTEIARRIQALAADGLPFDSIGILLRDPSRYQPLLEEALHRAGIPFYFTRGAVRPDAAGRAFLALLACANEQFPATRFAEYLSLGQMPEPGRAVAAGQRFLPEDDLLWTGAADQETGTPAEAAEPARVDAPAAWEQLIVDAAVVGTRERWRRRLQGLENEFRLRLSKLPEDEGERARIERQLEQLKNLESAALPVIDHLASLPKAALWGEWIERLTDLAESTLANPESVIQALLELWTMGEVGPVTLEEVLQVLSDRLRFLRRLPPRRRYGQVWIGAIEEARGSSFEVVFLPGLAEGVFPKRALEDPLLLDELRRTLSACVPLRDDRVAEERLRLRTAAASARTQLVVSYPRMDAAQNRPRVPSFYAMEVVRAAEGKVPELKAFERRAAAGALTRLGWPAPSDAQKAVDALEFDLSVLQDALSRPRGASRGVARYLFEVNPHLRRTLVARYKRWGREWSAADGLMCQDAESRELLAKHRLRNRPWSASTLQLFASCPYKFVLHGIHYLRPREESVPLQMMDPLTRGSLFHEVIFELFQRARTAADFPVIADRVLDDVAAKYEDALAPAIPRVWRGEVEDLRADLRGWLRRREVDAEGWEPIHCEYAFGLSSEEGRDAQSTKEPASILDGILVRGSVDWIERHVPAGDLRITDHKTGKAPKMSIGHVNGGASLQPLLYTAAVQNKLGIPVKFSRLYYCTQRGGYHFSDVPVGDEAMRNLQKALNLIDDSIAEGKLPAAPARGHCAYCDYSVACGPREEERLRLKPAFNPLVALRSIR